MSLFRIISGLFFETVKKQQSDGCCDASMLEGTVTCSGHFFLVCTNFNWQSGHECINQLTILEILLKILPTINMIFFKKLVNIKGIEY